MKKPAPTDYKFVPTPDLTPAAHAAGIKQFMKGHAPAKPAINKALNTPMGDEMKAKKMGSPDPDGDGDAC